MGDNDREQLRRLAGWLACRRDSDEAVAHLTRYGPAATDQVTSHLTGLKALLAVESAAFASCEAGAGEVPQRPLPMSEPLWASVHSLQDARDERV